MSRLIETIRLENGAFQRLPYHQQRLDNSLKHFYPKSAIDLGNELSKKDLPKQGLYKCRVIYDFQIQKIEFEPYTIRRISSLKIMEIPNISYPFKLEDRSELMKVFSRRGECDEVLITKHGLITDTSYSNIAFRKDDEWFTPASYLLPGTMRHYLLDQGIIQETHISVSDIVNYTQFKLINSMIGWEGETVDVSNIF